MTNEKGFEALDNVDRALLERVEHLSDAELLAELAEDGLSPDQEAADVLALSRRASARGRMAAAKSAVTANRSRLAKPGSQAPGVPPGDLHVARGMTLAARNGKTQSEADIRSLAEDIAELGGMGNAPE